jgi:endoglucanase
MKKTILLFITATCLLAQSGLKINSKEYLEMPGLNVMVFHDYYPEGHQTGVTVIQHGTRVAANGDVRFDPSPNQWSPIPAVGKRTVNKETNEISVSLVFPDPKRDKKGFNPIDYPNLKLNYSVRVKGEGTGFRIYVDLDSPLPEEWVGKIGFNFELFPGLLFGKSFMMDKTCSFFPRQASGPMYKDNAGEYQMAPMAEGRKLIVAPECDEQRMTIESMDGSLMLIDGRGKYNNGWFVVRSLIPGGKTKGAVEWLVSPNVIPGWKYQPVVQISQVGYHPSQSKIAIIETDKTDSDLKEARLIKIYGDGRSDTLLSEKPAAWGEFIRYKYYKFDFSKITDEGIYRIEYGKYKTSSFPVSKNVYSKNVWQPTLEYFLPVQMCHMRVNDRYRVWHGLCHDDDAMMAPINFNHIDGYFQGPSTLTKYKPFEHVPDLNSGGWHDAGDYDLRVESQAETVQILALANEEFNVAYDETTVDQKNKIVEIHMPDGKPDILEQIEHGLISIVNGYKSLGRLYRGIISPTVKQYTLLGDATNMTDHLVYDPALKADQAGEGKSGKPDDNFVFTEDNPMRELYVAGCLATGYRAIKNFNPDLAEDCVSIAEELWKTDSGAANGFKIGAAVELLLSTNKEEYKKFLLSNSDLIVRGIERYGWMIGRVLPLLNNEGFNQQITAAMKNYKLKIDELQKENPYGVPYSPDIWGAGWNIQEFGREQYYLYKSFPGIFSIDYMLNALQFVLGRHPGSNTASFASGVGINSLTVAYGANREDWSYIPGGVGSGTALIRPDLPELKTWPYFWQQSEYVMGGGATDFMFLTLAADKLLNK